MLPETALETGHLWQHLRITHTCCQLGSLGRTTCATGETCSAAVHARRDLHPAGATMSLYPPDRKVRLLPESPHAKPDRLPLTSAVLVVAVHEPAAASATASATASAAVRHVYPQIPLLALQPTDQQQSQWRLHVLLLDVEQCCPVLQPKDQQQLPAPGVRGRCASGRGACASPAQVDPCVLSTGSPLSAGLAHCCWTLCLWDLRQALLH